MPYAVDVPESTHDNSEISELLVVVASYPVSCRTIELVLPVPHTTVPAAVPYAAPTASVVSDASAAPIAFEPEKRAVAVTPVGIVYTAVDASAVRA